MKRDMTEHLGLKRDKENIWDIKRDIEEHLGLKRDMEEYLGHESF